MTKQCKICNSKTSSFRVIKSNKLYHKCINCDFIWLDDNFIVSNQIEMERYNLHENTIENTGYVNFFKNFINFAVTPYKEQVKTILDYGCGTEPVLAELLKNEGYKVNYYDLYFHKNEYKNKNYDMVLSTEVIEHTKSPLKIIKDLLSVITNDGILAIMTLFTPPKEQDFNTWWYKDDITHISFFTENTFKIICSLLECKIISSNNKNIIVLQKTKP